MLFNSVAFLIFLPTVLFLYWFVIRKNFRLQNLLILVSSYVFYGWWDWRFLSLIFISSSVDYISGLQIEKHEEKRKRLNWVLLSIFVNLGILGFFKYYNFFVDSFIEFFKTFGLNLQARTLNVILPVGISFYTFQALSYSIDIYRKQLHPTKDFIAYLSFVAFFPHMVAGPIMRARILLPQFLAPRKFDMEQTKDGLREMLWGFFKKIVVADNCSTYVNYIFSHHASLNGSALFLGVLFFAFQIYGDFSGYSDIARGTAKLFGFNLIINFKLPYFSRNIAEFWKRWHIALSTWFQDYVFIPLGGNKGGKLFRIRNILLTFTISGLWHGANWTFIIWGFLNGLYYVPLILMNKERQFKGVDFPKTFLPGLKATGQMLLTFFLILISWVFFRSKNIQQAFEYFGGMISSSLFAPTNLPPLGLKAGYFIIIMVICEWIQRNKNHVLEIGQLHLVLRWAIYYAIIGLIFLFFKEDQAFIYFQF